MIRQYRSSRERGGNETLLMTYETHSGADLSDEIENGDSTPLYKTVAKLLRGRWHWAVLLALLIGAAGLYGGYHVQPDLYTGISTIELKPNYNVAVDVQDPTQNESYRNFVSSQIRTLMSLEVISGAMEQPEWLEAVAQRPTDLSPVTLDKFVDKLVLTEPERYETVMVVEFFDPDPETARAGLNALLASYGNTHKQSKTDQIDDNLRLLNNQLRGLESEKATTERQISMIIPGDELQTINSRLESKLRELAAMDFRLSDIDLTLKPFLDALENPDADPDALDSLGADDEMQDLLLDKRKLEDEYIYLTEVLGRGEKMPDVVTVRRNITMVDRQINDLETKRLAAKGTEDTQLLPPAVAELMAKRTVILKKIEALTAETSDLGTRISAAEEYKVKLEDIRQSIRTTKEKIAQYEATLSFSQNDDVSRIVIDSPIQTPTMPSNSLLRIQLAGLGGVLGLSMGFGLMMLVGAMDSRVRHASDTVAGTPDVSVLGVLPTLPAKLTDPDEAEAVAHCVHHIRTLMQIGGTNRVFSITSPTAGAGKSSLATALGMSFAASGSRTLVIDADLVGAGISRRMGLVVHEALDVVIRRNSLLDEAQLSSAMTKATVSGKLLEQVLIDEKLMSQEQLEVAQRLQQDTSLGLLDACGPRQLAPPVRRDRRDDDVLIMLDEPLGSVDQDTSNAHHEEPAISMFDHASQSWLMACVAQAGIENLSILPVGKARPSDASRLSPSAMRELVRQAREAFDIVLVDTGPVLGSIEASVAAAEADATVLIVSRGDHKSLITRSLNQLRSVRAQIAGLVFNHALNRDLDHVSYASQISQERRGDLHTRKKALDRNRSARLGPLGTAVASYSDE